MSRNLRDALNRSIVSNELVLDGTRPEVELDEVLYQVLIDTHKLSSQHSPGVDVGCEWLEALIISQDLGRRGSWHWSHEEGVSGSVFHYVLPELVPVVSLSEGAYTPQVELELALAERRTLESLVMSFFLCDVDRSLHGGVVDGLEDLLGQIFCSRVLEGNSEDLEAVGEALHSNSDGTVAHVRVLSLWDRVMVSVDYTVQILGNSTGYSVELLVVECFCRSV